MPKRRVSISLNCSMGELLLMDIMFVAKIVFFRRRGLKMKKDVISTSSFP